MAGGGIRRRRRRELITLLWCLKKLQLQQIIAFVDSFWGSSIRVHIISDVHLEFYERNFRRFAMAIPGFSNDTNCSETFLFLAGDVAKAGSLTLASFLRKVANMYKAVFYVPGNHEYYSGKRTTSVQTLRECAVKMEKTCKQHSNVFFLDNEVVDMGDFIVAGSTLWGALPSDKLERIEKRLNDFEYIYTSSNELMTPSYYCSLSECGKDFMTDVILNSSKPVIALSHHAPNPQSLCQPALSDLRSRFGDLPSDELTAPYANSMTSKAMQSPSLKAWIHGHTHCSSITTTSCTAPVLCNAVGVHSGLNLDFSMRGRYICL